MIQSELSPDVMFSIRIKIQPKVCFTMFGIKKTLPPIAPWQPAWILSTMPPPFSTMPPPPPQEIAGPMIRDYYITIGFP